MQQGTRKAKWLSLIVAAAMVLCMLPVAAFAAGDGNVVTGVKVVDGTDGITEVTAPAAGQKLTANIQTNNGEIGSYPVNEDAHYKWYYRGSDVVLGTEPTYTVTEDNVGKVLCVTVSVDGYAEEATWTAQKQATLAGTVIGVKVVDGVDGITEVTTPKADQKLTANIQTSNGEIGSYPVNEDAHYRWYYEDSDTVLGTEPTYTVTKDNIGKVLCLDVTVDNYDGYAAWQAAAGTALAGKVTGVKVVDGADGVTEVTTPKAGQKLTANIQTSNGEIGSYPVNGDAHYKWHYRDSDAVLGTEPTYTVTEENVGKVLCVDVTVDGYAENATWTAQKQAAFAGTVTGVKVVDGFDGVTEIKAPVAGQKLTANIQTSNGEIGSYPVNEDAHYKWHYEGSDAVLGTEPTYTVTEENVGKVLCVDVAVDGYDKDASWKATAGTAFAGTVTGVKVVDGTDGVTEVKAPVAGQKLTANIQTSNGEIGSYPVNENASYKWYYEGSDTVLGTEPTYTVTSDNVGKVLCVDVAVDNYADGATWTAQKQTVFVGTITGVKVVDGTDGYTEVTAPKVGQKLTANIQTSEGEIGSYPVNEDAHYKWYYEGSDAVLGTDPTYTVTGDNVGKVLCVEVTVDGYEGSASWKATAASAFAGTITGVKVVDGTDGYTVVTAPKVGQKLTANIQTSEGEIGSYPVNEDAHYKWYYEGSDAVLGTDPTYTVTGDNEGKVLCVEVTVDGYEGSATWKAEKAVMMSVLVPIEGAAIAIEGVGDEKYVTGVMAGMEANEVIALFEEAQAGARIVVLDQEGNELGEKLVGTGCTVKLVDEADVILDAVVVVIDGDVQGDGEVNVLDLIAMARHVTNSEEPQLMGVYFKAADVNADENVNVLDMIAVCKAIIE